MPDLASAVFVLRPPRSFEKRQFMGRAAHKLFLLMLAALDAPASTGPCTALANRLHDQQDALPVTVSDLFQSDANHYWLRITALEASLADVLAQMVRGLPGRAVVDGWQVVSGLDDQHEWARKTTLADFVSAHWRTPPQPLTLEFVSPTLLKSVGIDRLYPEPALVFRLLYERLLKLPELALPFQPPVALLETFAGGLVSISGYELTCETAAMKVPMTGFRGWASYMLQRDNDALRKREAKRAAAGAEMGVAGLYDELLGAYGDYARLLNVLANVAFYSGLGRYTAQGMGMVRPRSR